jgi:hypothetical protein
MFGELRVIDSRPNPNKSTIRRRRICEGCGHRFTTEERIVAGGTEVGQRPPTLAEKMSMVAKLAGAVARELESKEPDESPAASSPSAVQTSRDATAAAVDSLQGAFTIKDVRQALVENQFKEQSLLQAFREYARDAKLQRVSKEGPRGQGRKVAWQKPADPSATHADELLGSEV